MVMTPQIEQLIGRFVSGADTSVEAANEIEVTLDDSYPDDDYMQQTVEMLAMYRPKGGDLLFDVNSIQKRLTETLYKIKRKQ